MIWKELIYKLTFFALDEQLPYTAKKHLVSFGRFPKSWLKNCLEAVILLILVLMSYCP